MSITPVDHEKNLKIMNNPKYLQLTTARNSFAGILSAVVILMYFGFILLIAYGKEVLGQPLAEGMTATVGFPLGVAVIVAAIVMTGIYVRRANSEFDDLNKQIIKEAHE